VPDDEQESNEESKEELKEGGDASFKIR